MGDGAAVCAPERTSEAVSKIRVLRSGRLTYAEGLALQQRLANGRRAGAEPDTLILLEHHPVITLGRGGKTENLLFPKAVLEKQGVEVHESDRGGDVTYHGPGQVVAYPIFDLNPDRCDVRRYVCDLERVMIDLCADYGLVAGRKEKMIGTWLGGDATDGATGPWRKIGAIGVHLSRWITTHGLAFNVSTNMNHFNLIVPCGLTGLAVTSLSQELGQEQAPTVEETMDAITGHFARVFGARVYEG